jgi:hypothetical protein
MKVFWGEKRAFCRRPKKYSWKIAILLWGKIFVVSLPLDRGNVSGGNEPLRANYENFNLSHMMFIQRALRGCGSSDFYL